MLLIAATRRLYTDSTILGLSTPATSKYYGTRTCKVLSTNLTASSFHQSRAFPMIRAGALTIEMKTTKSMHVDVLAAPIS